MFEKLKSLSITKRKIIKLTLVSILLSFVSLAIVGLQLLYPFHVVIGLGVYILSFIPFVRRVYLSRHVWRQHDVYRKTDKFIRREKWRITFSVLMFLVILVVITVRPFGGSSFSGISDQEIRQSVQDDLYESVVAMDYLESSAQELVSSLQSQTEDSNATEDIENSFADFLQAVVYSEVLTERNRHFADIPYRLWEERVTSFAISYSLYVKKYELLNRIMSEVSGSEYKKKVLNQYVVIYERGNIYREMVNRFYVPKTRLRITGGWLYLSIFGDDDNEYSSEYRMLATKAQEGHQYLFANFDRKLIHTGEAVVDGVQGSMFEVWFPVQRSIANTMGHIVISDRAEEKLITTELIIDMQQEMLPGDVMLQRRNWYLSNVGIPGFWTHAALYTGTLEEMSEYFLAEFPYQGYEDFSGYFRSEFPAVYADYDLADEHGYQKSVIEAIEPGVVVQSLEESAHADFVSVLRPRLTKKDKMLALFKAFGNYHKPYDYNFDFDTRDALVCSELIYDAYFERLPDKNGLQFETSLVNGRKITSPLDMAKKYQFEHGSTTAQFDFVYFIRGYKDEGLARVATEAEFLASVDWNKFSFLQE